MLADGAPWRAGEDRDPQVVGARGRDERLWTRGRTAWRSSSARSRRDNVGHARVGDDELAGGARHLREPRRLRRRWRGVRHVPRPAPTKSSPCQCFADSLNVDASRRASPASDVARSQARGRRRRPGGGDGLGARRARRAETHAWAGVPKLCRDEAQLAAGPLAAAGEVAAASTTAARAPPEFRGHTGRPTKLTRRASSSGSSGGRWRVPAWHPGRRAGTAALGVVGCCAKVLAGSKFTARRGHTLPILAIFSE